MPSEHGQFTYLAYRVLHNSLNTTNFFLVFGSRDISRSQTKESSDGGLRV